MTLSMCIDRSYCKCKQWLQTETSLFIGSVFQENRLLSAQEVSAYLHEIKTMEQAVVFAKGLNGSFAMVLDLDGTIILAVDRERTIPLFYEVNGDAVRVYNHLSLKKLQAHGVNKTALAELDNALFVSGNKTLATDIYAVTAGEVVTIVEGSVQRQYYFSFDYAKGFFTDKAALFYKIDNVFTAVTKRLITYLNGRCAIVPLSGGHDSRLVVYYLKKLGYDNIITYTYGPKGNFEATTSEKVANFLGVEWHNVEYRPKRLQNLFQTKFEELVDYCSNGVSSVCVQDWYAVDALRYSGVFPQDAVFVPGHSFDCIAGSFILPKYVENDVVSKQQLIDDLLWKHYSEGERKLSSDKRAYFEDIIMTELLQDEAEMLLCDRAFNLYQNFNVRERQAKFICSQTKLYEYYGYDWYIPLWDTALIDFWETIDLKQKYNRQIFFEFTEHEYGELMKAAPVENDKKKSQKKVNMNPFIRLFRKIFQLINYVDFHYCLAYFSRWDVYSMYLRKRVLNIGFFVNQKIIKILNKIES